MKKKLVSLMLCAAVAVCGTVAGAQETDSEKSVSVFVDNRTVYFEDQEPVIEDSRTLVPLRGVLEAMDAKVEWNEENRRVTINSYDNRTRLILTIDNPEIRKLNFITVTDTDLTTVTTDVAPKIINDRTMIPLRVISENMDADVDWNPESYIVDIKTKQYNKAVAALAADGIDAEAALAKATVGMTLSTDKTEVAKGDIVTVTVSLENTDAISDCLLAGGSIGVFYDSDSFDYLGYKTFAKGEEVSAYIGADNPEFKEDSVKAVFLLDPQVSYEPADGAFVQLQFAAAGDKGGEFILSDRLTNVGNDTYLSVTRNGKSVSLANGYELRIDAAPLAVSISEASEPSDDKTPSEESEPSDDKALSETSGGADTSDDK